MNLQCVILVLFVSSCHGHGWIGVDRRKIPTDTVKALATVSTTAAKLPVIRAAGVPVVFTADLNNDGIPDTITLVSSTGDTATFDTITISIARFGRQIFHAADTASPWTRVDDWFLDSNKNTLLTNKFFLTRGKAQSVLLLFGELDGAGERDDFSIINIEHDTTKLVLDQNERHLYIEAPISLGDLDGDGRLEFVYRQIFEFNGQPDTLNGKIGTYSPYFVYTVDSNCVLNKPLTIRYNQDHYVFAGFRYDERIEVFYPNDKSKPRLWRQ